MICFIFNAAHWYIHITHIALFPKVIARDVLYLQLCMLYKSSLLHPLVYHITFNYTSHHISLEDVLLNVDTQPIQFHMCFCILTFFGQIEYAILLIYSCVYLSKPEIYQCDSEDPTGIFLFLNMIYISCCRKQDTEDICFIVTGFSSTIQTFNTNGWRRALMTGT